MRRKTPVLPLAVAALMLAAGLGATTMLKMSTGDMAVAADTIVIGQCKSAESRWIDGALMTLVEVEVAETLKGAGASGVTMVIPGGIDASRPVPVAVTVPGAPSVFRDESVLLFLGNSAAVAGAFDVVGFSQGIYQVVEDARGNMLAAQGTFTGSNGGSLDELKSEIRRALDD